MSKQFFSKVSGVTYGNRQAIIEDRIDAGDALELEREPGNPNDQNAIAVYTSRFGEPRELIGYLNAQVSAELSPLMDAGQVVECTVEEVTGEMEATRGVNISLEVFDPEESAAMHAHAAEVIKNIQTPARQPAKRAPTRSSKNFIVLLILWFFTGYLGGHRIYAGRGSWLYSLTFGYLLIGWMIDLVIILTGQFKDGRGKPIRLF